MIDLRTWPLAKVLLASVLWVVLLVGLAAALSLGVYLYVVSQSHSTGSGGIGAVSFGISEPLLLLAVALLFGPPIVLPAIWFFMRRSRA